MELRTRARSETRRMLRSAYTAFGTVTADARMQPRFLIAGAQRCGTTSLFRMLARHPEVAVPARTKGIHYFDTAARYARGPRFYSAHFPLRQGNDKKITGEASPYYMFHPSAPYRIADSLPGVRVIILLRDPVERAFSAHKQEVWRGFESLPFEAALEAEGERLLGEEEKVLADPLYQSFAHQHHAYVGRGQYAYQLRRMATAIGWDNLLVLDADEFFMNPAPQWQRVLDHVGLRDAQAVRPVKANARPSAPMQLSTRRWLEEQFTESNSQLKEFLARSPDWL